jgi:hypothetical protein
MRRRDLHVCFILPPKYYMQLPEVRAVLMSVSRRSQAEAEEAPRAELKWILHVLNLLHVSRS